MPETAADSPGSGQGASITPDNTEAFGGSDPAVDQGPRVLSGHDDKAVFLTAEELRVLEGGGHVCR